MTTLNSLILSLPTANSTMRMRAWRALKEAGCGVLRDGVYVLPASSPAGPVLAELESEIRSAGGFAMTVELKLNSAGQRTQVRALFDRTEQYGALMEKMNALRAALAGLGARKAHTSLRRLQRSLDDVAQIDFFPGQAKRQAVAALSALERRFQDAYSGGEPRPSKKAVRALSTKSYQKRVWATRKDPWVDRLASAWLIKRFIDRGARFVWIDHPRERPRKAVGFDFDGAQFTHVKDRVTYEVLLASFGLENDAALARIGAAVHFLDTGGVPAPDAKGLETVLRGVKEKARDDDALLAEAIRIFDLFYSAYARG
jgi:hypothetical protein